MIKLPSLPKIIGSILNVRASSNIDVSEDLAKDTATQKSISQLLEHAEKEEKKQQN